MSTRLFSKKRDITPLITVVFLITMLGYGQTTKYNQFWGELKFNRALTSKWSAELDLRTVYSSSESSPNLFDHNIKRSFRGWGHYFFSPRWKFSSFIAYFNNKDVPEIGQYESPEWRFALQGTYYFHKKGYTLSTRMRTELRHMKDEDGTTENIFRYRQQIKYIQPLNSKVLRSGVIYATASEEIILKSGTKNSNQSIFDRNRFDIGAGYLFTDNIQVEVTYLNDYLPRNNSNSRNINALYLTFTFNNLLKDLSQKASHKEETEHDD